MVVTVEGGGFGADTAAPAARDILNAIFDVKPGQIEDTGGDPGTLIRWTSDPTDTDANSRPTQTFDERSAGFAERTGFLRMDPWHRACGGRA